MLTWLEDLTEIKDGPLLRFVHSPTLLSAARSDIREFLGEDGSGGCAGGKLLRGILDHVLGERYLEVLDDAGSGELDIGVVDQEAAIQDARRKCECRMLILLSKPTLGLEELILSRLLELKQADEPSQKPTT